MSDPRSTLLPVFETAPSLSKSESTLNSTNYKCWHCFVNTQKQIT